MIVLATTNEEVSWLRCLQAEIPLCEKPMSIVLIQCDSNATIEKIDNHYYNNNNDKRRQIRRKYNIVRKMYL